MKRGEKTYQHVEGRANRMLAVRKLSDKDLSALARYLEPQGAGRTELEDEILALVICEAAARWLRGACGKEKGKPL